jgi:hypothetical protein
VENALLPWLLSCPAVQKPLPVRTLSASSVPLPVRAWHGADAVALVGAEMEEGEEEEVVANVGGTVHPEDWRCSRIETDGTAAPQEATSSARYALGRAEMLRVRWHRQGIALGIGSIEEDQVGVGMSCACAMSFEHIQLTDWGKHALPQSLAPVHTPTSMQGTYCERQCHSRRGSLPR